jgi:hypothetical protein
MSRQLWFKGAQNFIFQLREYLHKVEHDAVTVNGAFTRCLDNPLQARHAGRAKR